MTGNVAGPIRNMAKKHADSPADKGSTHIEFILTPIRVGKK